MIELIIFHLHILAALYVFTKNWQNIGIKDAFLAVSVVALVFIVGWSISQTIADLIFPASWHSKHFNADTFALSCFIIPEILFFYLFFVKDNRKAE